MHELEREIRRHIAGLKTNALVSVGAALYVGLSLVVEGESSPTRIAAQLRSRGDEAGAVDFYQRALQRRTAQMVTLEP